MINILYCVRDVLNLNYVVLIYIFNTGLARHRAAPEPGRATGQLAKGDPN